MRVHHDDATTLGTASWVGRTAGRLTAGERRGLLGPLVRTHLRNTVGRLRLATGLHPGRTAYVPPARLAPPDTVLTRAARDRVRQEAMRMPEGRAQFLHRYGAFAAAVKLAPYDE